MNIAIGIAVTALVVALWLERKRRVVHCDSPYNLIDLQEEIRRRAEARRKEEDENR